MLQTGENVADHWGISRDDQDRFALASQERAAAAIVRGRMAVEIIPVMVPQEKGGTLVFGRDEHPRATTLDALARLRPVVRADGTVTAGNASGLNDGSAAMIVASEAAAVRHGLTPRARVLGMAAAGIAPRIMGAGPIEAARRLTRMTGIGLDQVDVIELNEAFASQAIATLRDLGISQDDPRVNRNGGAIALGHPLGMSGARITMSAVEELQGSGGRYALAFMCIGVGQASRSCWNVSEGRMTSRSAPMPSRQAMPLMASITISTAPLGARPQPPRA